MLDCNCNKGMYTANFTVFLSGDYAVTAPWSRQVLTDKLFILSQGGYNSEAAVQNKLQLSN